MHVGRLFTPIFVFCAALVAPMTASASGGAYGAGYGGGPNRAYASMSRDPGRASSALSSTSGHSARAGSVGIGNLRMYLGKKVETTSNVGGGQTNTTTRRSIGVAWVKKDGRSRPAGALASVWHSQTKNAYGQKVSTAAGYSRIHGTATRNTWVAQHHAAGVTAMGTGASIRGRAVNGWVEHNASTGRATGHVSTHNPDRTAVHSMDLQTGATRKTEMPSTPSQGFRGAAAPPTATARMGAGSHAYPPPHAAPARQAR